MESAPHGLDAQIGFKHGTCFRILDAEFFGALKGMYDDLGIQRAVPVFRMRGDQQKFQRLMLFRGKIPQQMDPAEREEASLAAAHRVRKGGDDDAEGHGNVVFIDDQREKFRLDERDELSDVKLHLLVVQRNDAVDIFVSLIK